MQCTGVDAITGHPVAVTFGAHIDAIGNADSPDPRRYLAPGLIDLQVNGFAGVDYNDPAAPIEELARSIRHLFSTGITRFYPTVVTGSAEKMTGALRNLANAKEKLPEGAAIEGFHLEGPHISPEDGPRGGHPRQWVRPPDVDELLRMQEAARGLVRLVTLAPEWPEATRYIERAVREGMVVAIGHTNADAAQIDAAVRAGATMSTHLGNGAHPMLPRHPNYIWDQLADDRLTAGFIADGMHLPGAFLKAAFRAKGPDRRFLATDMVMPACSTPGRYFLTNKEVELTPDYKLLLVGKNAGEKMLAGSAMPMHKQVANVVRLTGLSLGEAVRMATIDPARAGKLAERDKGLVAGQLGDVIEFRFDAQNPDLEIERTYLDGALVYERH